MPNARSNQTSVNQLGQQANLDSQSRQHQIFESYREYSNRTSPKIPLIKSGQSMIEYNRMIHKQIQENEDFYENTSSRQNY